MRVDQIEIHAGGVDFEYEAVRQLEAKCEAKTAWSKSPTMEDVNLKLQEMAAGIGADAVVNVAYNSGVSMTSWRSMKATGLAVRRVSDDIACPICAEKIKRAAKKCRFCGAELVAPSSTRDVRPASVEPDAISQPWERGRSVAARPTHRAPMQPPLKATDNPQWVIWLFAGFVILMAIIAALGG
jgi:hypothetical protein